MNEDFLAILIAIPLCIAALVWYYRTDRGKKDLKDLEKAKQDLKAALKSESDLENNKSKKNSN
tara:strand:- start:693 stop:881 length:189 start_codon:yes stop_codon:yes gene_type:complete